MPADTYGETLRRLAMPDVPNLPGLTAHEFTDPIEIFEFKVFKQPLAPSLLEAMMHFLVRAVDEYQLAHEALKQAAVIYNQLGNAERVALERKEQIPSLLLGAMDTADSNVVHLFDRGRDHLELCVNLLRRAIFFGRRYAKSGGRPELPRKVERLGVFSDAVASRIIEVRNALEHADERFVNGEVDTIWVRVESEAISYAAERLYYTEIIEWFREFDSLISFIFQPFAEIHKEEDEEYEAFMKELDDESDDKH